MPIATVPASTSESTYCCHSFRHSVVCSPVVSSTSPPSKNGAGSGNSLVATHRIPTVGLGMWTGCSASSFCSRTSVTATTRDIFAHLADQKRCSMDIGFRAASSYRRRIEPTAEGAPLTTQVMHEGAVVQERRLVTAIPGPVSQRLQARKTSAVPSGVGTTLPVYVTAAAGGVVVDADGNSLIDFGSGIAVTTVGNSAPAVVDAVTAQVQAFTHTCFMVTPYDGYVAVAEALNAI